MQTVASFADLRRARKGLTGTFGLVPTPGDLHAGHLSLVRQARAECDHVGVSLVAQAAHAGGPGQGTPGWERDLALLEPLGVDLVWAPAPEALFPPGYQTWVTVERASAPLEGKHRPGFFREVATLTARLFNAFSPARAYFGQKHAQQVVVIRQMVRDLCFPLEVVVCPTVREADGLAVSRQNARLGPAERAAATVLYRALEAARRAFEGGERDADMLRSVLSSTLAAEPLAREEYVSVADPDSLDELSQVATGALLSLAAHIGTARLIDNCLLE